MAPTGPVPRSRGPPMPSRPRTPWSSNTSSCLPWCPWTAPSRTTPTTSWRSAKTGSTTPRRGACTQRPRRSASSPTASRTSARRRSRRRRRRTPPLPRTTRGPRTSSSTGRASQREGRATAGTMEGSSAPRGRWAGKSKYFLEEAGGWGELWEGNANIPPPPLRSSPSRASTPPPCGYLAHARGPADALPGVVGVRARGGALTDGRLNTSSRRRARQRWARPPPPGGCSCWCCSDSPATWGGGQGAGRRA
mmetsp:Transcript_837/g.3007  ORF Transcript_837/g.3007 Transcript_837/m.3007 type:complete len:250 (+) Transcript_837:739-1488(+)